jgi:hypothetical protein
MGAGVAASPRSPRLPIAPPRPGDHPLGGWVPERGETSFGSRGSRTERERSGASRRRGFRAVTLQPRLAAPQEGKPSCFAWLGTKANPLPAPRFESEANPPLSPGSGAGRDRRPCRLLETASGQARSQPLEGGSQAGSEDPAGALTEVRLGAIPSASPGLGIAFRASSSGPAWEASLARRAFACAFVRPAGSAALASTFRKRHDPGERWPRQRRRRPSKIGALPLRPPPATPLSLTNRRAGQADSACGKRG